MNQTARRASSPWIKSAMLSHEPGMILATNGANHMAYPDMPIMAMPQKTAQ